MFARLWSLGKIVFLEKEDCVKTTPVSLGTQHIHGIVQWACVLETSVLFVHFNDAFQE